jgi:hypothetical protein
VSKDEVRRLKGLAGLSTSPGVPGSGPGILASKSLTLQSLYAKNAVKYAFYHLTSPVFTFDSDDDDLDDSWEDNMDPITFARCYAADSPLLTKIVQDHDRKMRERLNQGIADWVKAVQPGHSDFGAS